MFRSLLIPSFFYLLFSSLTVFWVARDAYEAALQEIDLRLLQAALSLPSAIPPAFQGEGWRRARGIPPEETFGASAANAPFERPEIEADRGRAWLSGRLRLREKLPETRRRSARGF